MKNIFLRSAHIFDGEAEDLRQGDVLVSDGIIADVSYDRCEPGNDWEVFDFEGKSLMPGLIDARVHVYRRASTLLEWHRHLCRCRAL